MKDLPTGIGTFSILIENDYIYVDKTKFIHKMAKPGKKYFLSRPRRFGKSLFLSTLKELYKGNKELFKGLYIYDKWDWSKTCPVIHLNMIKASKNNLNGVKESLNNLMDKLAYKNNIKLFGTDPSDKLAEIIEEISLKNNSKVVVLIDEYDKPILDNISDLKLADDIRKELNNFYGVLKDDEFLEFVFVTGVTKFSKTSIFSGLNNLTDISFENEYSNICGYSQKELESYFNEWILNLTKIFSVSQEEILNDIKSCYNGYSYNGYDFLYNPYSILSLFEMKKFDNFWFETGTPSFLMEYMKNNPDIKVLFNPNPIIEGSFPNFELNNLDFKTLLLQTGYLTIKKDISKDKKHSKYLLGIPNKEVNNSLYRTILAFYTKHSINDTESLTEPILNAIITQDEESLNTAFNVILGSTPHQIYDGTNKNINEAFYKGLLFTALFTAGFNIQGEPSSHKGEVDFILKNNDLIANIEVKSNDKNSYEYMIKEAMKQIHEKKYYQPYLNKKVILIAVAIKNREVKCKMEVLSN
ncbi:MAG: ATP-binding protein [Methanobrevibacter sp.]|jgi:Holliday junction resolvase-like predicted endonuclease|nr:ATP-binding protein [Candidatus Methanoflexus mossambicus]